MSDSISREEFAALTKLVNQHQESLAALADSVGNLLKAVNHQQEAIGGLNNRVVGIELKIQRLQHVTRLQSVGANDGETH